MDLKTARLVSLGLIPIAVYLATEPTILGLTLDGLGIFEIFLFADLLATATVLPVLLTLSDKIDSRASLAGAICGLLSVVLYGVVTADLSTGIHFLISPTNDIGLANLGVFLSALIGSGLVTMIGSNVLREKHSR